jgi:hypothetical protein
MQLSLRKKFRPSVEPLEDRRLMTVSSWSLSSQGVLVVNGSAGNDTIQFHHLGGRISIEGVRETFADSAVKQIVVNAGRGDDVVHLDTQKNPGETAIKVLTVVFGGDGNDKIFGSDGDCYYDGGAGNDQITTGAGKSAFARMIGTDTITDGKNTGGGGNSGGGGNTGGGGTSDWFSANMVDTALQSLARNLDKDGSLSRADVLSLFRSAEESGGAVTTSEVASLRALLNNGANFGITEAVRNLGGKVLAGMGTAGTTAAGAENLVKHWFLGADHPVGTSAWGTTFTSFVQANGSLYVNGVSYTDVNQGGLGDCYFLSALADAANQTAANITNMFTDNGDGTFTVRFFNNSVADYVTVDRYLPTSNGMIVFAGMGHMAADAGNELWVALAEKAYVQWCADTTVRGAEANSFNAISGGYIADALSQILGRPAQLGLQFNETALIAAATSHTPAGLATKGTPSSSQIVGGHAYSLIGYNADTKLFTLFNPWGVNNGSQYPGIVTMTFAQLQANFYYWDKIA